MKRPAARRSSAKKGDPKPRVTRWPNSVFALKTRWEDWGDARHFLVYLERRAPGKFGRLEAMHAIVPSRTRTREADPLFGGARYRRLTLDEVQEFLRQAGVPQDQHTRFMAAILKEYPYPAAEELFLEQINRPLFTMAFGKRLKELSYYKTGIPELTAADLQLVRQCLTEWGARTEGSPIEQAKLRAFAFGGTRFGW